MSRSLTNLFFLFRYKSKWTGFPPSVSTNAFRSSASSSSPPPSTYAATTSTCPQTSPLRRDGWRSWQQEIYIGRTMGLGNSHEYHFVWKATIDAPSSPSGRWGSAFYVFDEVEAELPRNVPFQVRDQCANFPPIFQLLCEINFDKWIMIISGKASTRQKIVSIVGFWNEKCLTKERIPHSHRIVFPRSQCRCTGKLWMIYLWNWSSLNSLVCYCFWIHIELANGLILTDSIIFRRSKKTTFKILWSCQKINGSKRSFSRRSENSQMERWGHFFLATSNSRCQLWWLSRTTTAH